MARMIVARAGAGCGLLASLLLVLLPVPGMASQSDTVRYTPPTSIDATGAVDVTAQLQGFIASVPDGSVISLPAEARYRIEGTVTLVERRHLTIDGNRATLFATTEGDRNRAHVRLEGGSDLRIRELNIVGANPVAGLGDDAYREEREAQHGFEVAGAARVELDAVAVSDVYGDSVYIGAAPDKTWSSQVWVHDSRFERTGRQGVAVTAGSDVVIEHNLITQTRRATVDLEPNTPRQGARNIHILDNTVGPGRLLFVAAHGGGPVDDVVIAGNELRGRPLTISVTPPTGTRRANFYVVDNTSDTLARRTPMKFVRIDGVVVRDNSQPLLLRRAIEGEVGVETTDACSIQVVANDFGPETTALLPGGSPCGAPPDPQTPPPPAIPARDVPPPTPTTAPRFDDEAAAPSPRRPAAPPADAPTSLEAHDQDDGLPLTWVYPLVLIAAMGAGVGAVRLVRKRR